MSVQDEYNSVKEEHDELKQKAAELQGRQKSSKEELENIEKAINEKTKGRDADEVLALLEKEIETRLNLVREKVAEYEILLEEGFPSVDVGEGDEGEILGEDI